MNSKSQEQTDMMWIAALNTLLALPGGEANAVDAGKDVLDGIIMAEAAKPCRHARLSFGPREAGTLTLAEVETWGSP